MLERKNKRAIIGFLRRSIPEIWNSELFMITTPLKSIFLSGQLFICVISWAKKFGELFLGFYVQSVRSYMQKDAFCSIEITDFDKILYIPTKCSTVALQNTLFGWTKLI